MQCSRRIKNKRCLLDNVKTEHLLSFATPIKESSLNNNNLLLARQNSELKLKVAFLEEKLNIIKNQLIESQFECNSLNEANKQLEKQNKCLETMGRYGTRYFEKLGRSTELMIEKFNRSLEFEHSFNISQLSSTITPSLNLDSSIKKESRGLTVISEEGCVSNSNEDTPQIDKRSSRSRQLFTQKNVTGSELRKSSTKKIYLKKQPQTFAECKFQSTSELDIENQDTPDVGCGKRILRSGTRKNYILLPQNRKLRRGDQQLISVKPIFDDVSKSTTELDVYDLTD